MHSACITDDNCCKARGAQHKSRDVHWGRILGRNWEFSSLLFTVTSTNGFYSPSPLSKSGLKLVCNINIVYVNENLKPKNSQDYAQKHQRNCTFMHSASVQCNLQVYEDPKFVQKFRGSAILPASITVNNYIFNFFRQNLGLFLLYMPFCGTYIKSLLTVTVFLTSMETQS
jgi:hypothetical protein